MLKSLKLQPMSGSQQKNVINTIMCFLPDNRPITSLQIVEDYEKCPKNFTPINRTYDQDSDAALWRETNILFGKPTARYLCLSKCEGLPDYVVETLKIIGEKEHPPKEFSLLSRTADREQRAWRKKQIAYKLSNRRSVNNAITDIILCSKLKLAPEGFRLAGDINGILVCYKIGPIPFRIPPPVPQLKNTPSSIPATASEVEKALSRLNTAHKINHSLPPIPTDHDYEEIQSSYQLSPKRVAPKPPISAAGTLGAYAEVDGIPFILNPNLSQSLKMPDFKMPPNTDLNYDFQLERQILCTMKSSTSYSKNPFFH